MIDDHPHRGSLAQSLECIKHACVALRGRPGPDVEIAAFRLPHVPNVPTSGSYLSARKCQTTTATRKHCTGLLRSPAGVNDYDDNLGRDRPFKILNFGTGEAPLFQGLGKRPLATVAEREHSAHAARIAPHSLSSTATVLLCGDDQKSRPTPSVFPRRIGREAR